MGLNCLMAMSVLFDAHVRNIRRRQGRARCHGGVAQRSPRGQAGTPHTQGLVSAGPDRSAITLAVRRSLQLGSSYSTGRYHPHPDRDRQSSRIAARSGGAGALAFRRPRDATCRGDATCKRGIRVRTGTGTPVRGTALVYSS